MKGKVYILVLLCLLIVMCATKRSEAASIANEQSAGNQHRIAIVIDDLGNGMGGTEEIMAIDGPLTVAIMPFLPTTERDAEAAHAAGHEVIVHMPMEPKKGNEKWLGPGALTSDLSDAEVRERIEAAIDNVPYAVGMNNHMGSKITSNERIMRVVLEVCKERKLFYLDSKTNYRSVVGKLSQEVGVPYAENVLFLDDEHSASHIGGQMNKAVELLRDKQSTVIIGHVGVAGKKTAAAIEHSLSELQQYGKLVHLSELIKLDLINPEVL